MFKILCTGGQWQEEQPETRQLKKTLSEYCLEAEHFLRKEQKWSQFVTTKNVTDSQPSSSLGNPLDDSCNIQMKLSLASFLNHHTSCSSTSVAPFLTFVQSEKNLYLKKFTGPFKVAKSHPRFHLTSYLNVLTPSCPLICRPAAGGSTVASSREHHL